MFVPLAIALVRAMADAFSRGAWIRIMGRTSPPTYTLMPAMYRGTESPRLNPRVAVRSPVIPSMVCPYSRESRMRAAPSPNPPLTMPKPIADPS